MKIPSIILTVVLGLSAHAGAQALLTTQHVDIGLAEGAGLGLHWHDEDNDIEYEPGDAVAYFDPVDAKLTIPSGAQWSFLGTAGSDIWILPQGQNASLLFLGVGAEDADPGTFDSWNPGDSRGGANVAGRWVELSLISVSGPGEFSVWQTDGFGTPVAYMSTFATLSGGNRLYVQEGGHAHYNWGFTAEGSYDVLFQARSFIGGSEVTEQATFTFTSVPEPGSIALLALSAGVLGVYRWRKTRRSGHGETDDQG